MNQRWKFKLVAYIVIFSVLSGLLFWWFSFNNAQKRDYQRLSDMKKIQSELLMYFSRNNTFKISDCQSKMLISQCFDGKFFDVIDPRSNGEFNYVLENFSDDNFSVRFSLEQGIAQIKRGSYIMTKNGIQ